MCDIYLTIIIIITQVPPDEISVPKIKNVFNNKTIEL